LKFYDQKLHNEHQKYAEELFEIEMKLREVLSVIFIENYESDFYNLLEDVNNIHFQGDAPQESQMQTRFENQFFYLNFSQYKTLNDKKKIGNVDQIIKLLGQVTDFGAFQSQLTQHHIRKEEYSNFIARLKANLEQIEDLRNCVAHNRVIPKAIKDNYGLAKTELLKAIDEFLDSLPKGK
jgi:hypothetical protein